MRSGSEIVWSSRATADLEQILEYLEQNWAEKQIRVFIQKLETRISLISERPLLFPPSGSRKNVHRSVLIPQISIYYRYASDRVEILTLFDNRQWPGKQL